MRAIIQWTIWQRRWSVMWWSIGVALFMFINLIFYPTFKDQAAELEKSFENIPDSALQLLGGSSDFFSPVGFLNSQIYFIMLPLLLGILAIGLGSSLIAREEQDKTLEGLLARPVSRTGLLLAKASAGVLITLFVTIFALVTTIVVARTVELEVSAWYILQATFACFILSLSFGAVAFAIASFGQARVLSLGIATTVALGGYIVSSLAGTVSWLKTPSYLFPFHYYDSEAILRGSFNWNNIVVLICLLLFGIIISTIAFRKRDLG